MPIYGCTMHLKLEPLLDQTDPNLGKKKSRLRSRDQREIFNAGVPRCPSPQSSFSLETQPGTCSCLLVRHFLSFALWICRLGSECQQRIWVRSLSSSQSMHTATSSTSSSSRFDSLRFVLVLKINFRLKHCCDTLEGIHHISQMATTSALD